MLNLVCTRVLALSLIAPAAGLLPSSTHAAPIAMASAEAAALHARFDPSLGSMRAGRVDTSPALSVGERARLEAASQQAPSLAALRAGDGPTEQQWTWIAVGAVVVLLIILI